MRKWLFVLLCLMLALPACACAVDLASLEPGADGMLNPAYAIENGQLTLTGTAAYPVKMVLGGDASMLTLTLDHVSIPGGDDGALHIQYAGGDGQLVVVLEGENTLGGMMTYENPVADTGSPMRIAGGSSGTLTVGGIYAENALEIARCGLDVTGRIFAHDVGISGSKITVSATENGAAGENGCLRAYTGRLTLEDSTLEMTSDSCVAIDAAAVDLSNSSMTIRLSGNTPAGVVSSGVMTAKNSKVSVYADAAYPSGVSVNGAEITDGSVIRTEIAGAYGYGFVSRQDVLLSGSELIVTGYGDGCMGVEVVEGNLRLEGASRLSSVCTGESAVGVRLLGGSLEMTDGYAYAQGQGQAVVGGIVCGEGMIAQHRNGELDAWEELAEAATDRKQFRSFERVPFTYTLENSGVTVTGYTGTETEIVIPQKIEGRQVLAIGSGAFSRCSTLVSVTLPEGLKSIGNNAFSWCGALASVTLPEGLTDIGVGAFYNCDALGVVALPESLETIGGSALKNCDALTVAHIPAGVLQIGGEAFAECKLLTEITVDEGSESYISVDGVLYTRDMTTIAMYPAGRPGASYAIADTVRVIGGGAFSSSQYLESVELPQGVVTIGDSAFSMIRAKQITLPDGVTSIGVSAFYSSALRSIVIPDSVTSIGVQAFRASSSLESAVLPAGLTEIPQHLFAGCSSLTDAAIPESVRTIGQMAFYGTALESVVLPDGVESIGFQAYSECDALCSIVIPRSVTSIHEKAFADSAAVTASVYAGSFAQTWCEMMGMPFALIGTPAESFEYEIVGGAVRITGYHGTDTYVVIPDEIEGCWVTEIGAEAFLGCASITDVYFPNTLMAIGASAFAGCTSLTEVVLQEGLTEIGSGAFEGCTALVSALIPSTAVTLGDAIFDGCAESFAARVHYGSAAQAWCIGAGVSYVLIDAPWMDFGSSREEILENIGHEPGAAYALGDTGRVILFIQTALRELDYYMGEITGNCGTLTERAITAFQNDRGLTADGVCSEETLFALIDAFLACCGIASPDEPDMILPAGLRVIEREAFAGAAFRSVACPSGLEEIGARAFGDCARLEQIVIPASVKQIADDAFDGCGELSIFGEYGSAAERCAKEQGFAFYMLPESE